MFLATLRFMTNGWVEELYLRPAYHFPFFNWVWIQVYSPVFMYTLFFLLLLFSLGILLGLAYRLSAAGFFLVFSYIELADKTYYLNHYYFIMLVSFLLIFLPAHRRFSLDALWQRRMKQVTQIPYGYLRVIQLQLFMVYFFAGMAKVNSDWLLHAQPLRIWLPPHSHLPLVGGILGHPYTAWIMSWAGCLFDLSVGFALFYRPTRWIAYTCIVVFHVITGYLFPIGMFPLVMVLLTPVFFSPGLHERVLQSLEKRFRRMNKSAEAVTAPGIKMSPVLAGLFTVFLFIQFLLPFRYLLYPRHVFWTEQGFRFSWRVMLMEKNGVAFFRVKDAVTGQSYTVNNREWLTPLQEKMMATQPDMLVDYAHLLEIKYMQRLQHPVEVFAESYVTLNGRPSRLLVDTTTNLAGLHNGWQPRTFVTPSPEDLW